MKGSCCRSSQQQAINRYYTPHSWSQRAKNFFRPARCADFVVGQAIRLSPPAGAGALVAATLLGGAGNPARSRLSARPPGDPD
jgi:hypothetical protein